MLHKLGTVLSGIALAGLALSPCMAFAADAVPASEKVETINVTTDASGAVEEVEVETTLKNSGAAAELLDETNLTGIKGKDGATYTGTDGTIAWKADGGDVTYTGQTSAQLPISMHVTYRLDGREVAPAEIAGKAGKVSIRYDFSNDSPLVACVNGVETEMHVPFTCITALMMNGDDFSDVQVTNGKIIDDGSDAIVAGYAMPGLKQSLGSLAKDSDIPDYFEVTATTKNFELKSTMTIVTAGLMADMDIDALGFDDLDGTSAGLSEGISKLISGADELSNGMGELARGADKLNDGASSLASGASELSNGLYLLAYGQDGKSGLGAAASSSEELVEGLAQVDDSLATIADSKKGLPAVANGLSTLSAAYPDAKTLKALEAAVTASDMDEKSKAAVIGILESTGTVSDLSDGVSQYSDGIVKLSAGFTDIVKQSKSLPKGLADAAAAAKKLYGGASSLSDGADALSDATSQLSSGMESAADGSEELKAGLITFDEQGISKIVSTIDNDLGGLKKRLTVLSDAATAYDNFSGKEAGTASSVKFVYETEAIEAG